ncbi:fasciclin domain-containing protein [Aquimarina sp. 2201CG1-2-11]|uniref:fasciclin domain-containing protein n=1 Tax=Aquimarina discodermiae TaxID=3231043 RepID=UPI0034628232
MMKLTRQLTLIFIAFIVCFTSCNNDDDSTTTLPVSNTIADFVTNNANYSSLLAALQRTELDKTLAGDGSFTVFAPNNNAFETFLDGTALDDVPTETLRQLLLNHVIGDRVTSNMLTTGYVKNLAQESTTMANLSMYINTAGGVVINGESTVTTADISTDNGVIHAVDKVIPLPTIVTFATADATFSNLVAALTRDDQLDENYVATLSTANGTSPAPFTVFAPTDDAFASLLTELSAGSLADIDEATLTATLNLHVVAGANVRAEDLSSGTITTLGGDITADAPQATLTDANNRVSNIIVTDVQAANGVIHAIDKVILPAL